MAIMVSMSGLDLSFLHNKPEPEQSRQPGQRDLDAAIKQPEKHIEPREKVLKGKKK
jgi:hypothetical protein